MIIHCSMYAYVEIMIALTLSNDIKIDNILSFSLSLNIYIKIIPFVTRQYIRTLREQIYEARDMRGVPLLVVGNKQDELSPAAASGTRYRDIVYLVRKHWRCGYVECSARFNCRVVQVRIT